MRVVRRILPAVVLLAGLVSGRPAFASDIHVSTTGGDDMRDGSTWALAVASLARGLALARGNPGPDIIHVAAGTYLENALVDVADVSLLGGYPVGGGARSPATNLTTIDGGAAGPALAVSGAGGTMVLSGVAVDGFTITGGRSLRRGMSAFGGAGVFIEESAVALTNNVIRGNVADATGVMGGGVYVFRMTAGPTTITGNRIESNVVSNGVGGGGVALIDLGDPVLLGPLVLSGNELLSNQAVATSDLNPMVTYEPGGVGGGAFLWGGATVVDGNTVRSNLAEARVDQPTMGQGGGLFILQGSPVISNNTIESNVAVATAGRFGAAGGGAYVISASAQMNGNDFAMNESRAGTGSTQGLGGGLNVTLLEATTPVLTNNVVRGNFTSGGGAGSQVGGGVYAYVMAGAGARLEIHGGSIEENQAPLAGGGLYLTSSNRADALVDGTLIRANQADFASGFMALGAMQIRNTRIRENALFDPDGDLVSEVRDNCPGLPNGVQADADMDGQGDDCDGDDDGDGLADGSDNCRLVANPGQADANMDGQGDACQGDADGDGRLDGSDNCPLVANPGQEDATADGVGDACEPARFDPLETNASGIWLAGDSTLTNAELTDNIGHGLEIVGYPSMGPGMPADPATAAITNVTIANNAGVGFITYLATGTTWRDSLIASNLWSDGFDTQDAMGMPSSPGMICQNINFGDGTPSWCTGSGLISASPRFAMGPLGDYYLAQTAAGQALQSSSVDAGSRTAASSPVSGLHTRTDGMPDSGTVDLGFHHGASASPAPVADPLRRGLRAAKTPAGAPALRLQAPPVAVTSVRWYRGDLDLLPTEYSHRSTFSGQAGNPECAQLPAATFADTAAALDGRNWYYLAVPDDAGVEGSFGLDSSGAERPRPEDSPTDMVTRTCP